MLRYFHPLAFLAAVAAAPVHALTVLQPDGANDTVVAGRDFATQQLGNPWDMSDAADVRFPESFDVTGQSLAGGRYTAVSTGGDPYFYGYFGGFISSVAITPEARTKISTSRYRNFTAKVRYRAPGGGTLSGGQFFVLYFLKDTSFSPGTFNSTGSQFLQPNAWQIVSLDLVTQVSGSPQWTTFPEIGSLRVDPTTNPNVQMEIDWLRLTEPPAGAGTQYTVTWSDTQSGSYTVTAVDADGASLVLGSGITGTSYIADLSRLAPGNYRIDVSRGATTASSPGQVRIAAPPVVQPVRPDARGDQARNFATVETGNPWGPMDAADVGLTANLTNISYTSPAGSLSARPLNDDPIVVLNPHGRTIDTNLYRSLCYTMEVAGPQQVGVGSVARLLWGNATLATSDDIVIENGTNEYCIADMTTLVTEPPTPGRWTGSLQNLRLDPHEFPRTAACNSTPTPANCRDIRIDSVVLSPFHRADPNYTFRWNLVDADSATVEVRVWLDPDLIATNGNEIAVGTVQAAPGAGQLSWTAPTGTPLGRYNVLFVATEGAAQNYLYADGPLLVTATGASDLIFRSTFE